MGEPPERRARAGRGWGRAQGRPRRSGRSGAPGSPAPAPSPRALRPLQLLASPPSLLPFPAARAHGGRRPAVPALPVRGASGPSGRSLQPGHPRGERDPEIGGSREPLRLLARHALAAEAGGQAPVSCPTLPTPTGAPRCARGSEGAPCCLPSVPRAQSPSAGQPCPALPCPARPCPTRLHFSGPRLAGLG